ncbi:MAG: hypothetical protein NTZ32_11695 [Planctomycetales bacterium]|nr:hypothetical protein [Planctomycetales bacterium]
MLIVLVLLGMLSILGVIFYLFAAQEKANAEYYAAAAKAVEDPGLSADVLMDWALQQVVVGTDARLKNSALWGSRHSMIANMLGVGDHRITDTQLYNGSGVNVIFNPSGAPVVDQDHDGQEDSPALTRALLGINDSPAANTDPNTGDLLYERRLYPGNPDNIPQGDVGYTYPDVNNIFLAYVGWVRDNGNNLRRVVIPSYHRPQLMRDGGGAPYADWYQNPALTNRTLRAHPEHKYVTPSSSPTTVRNRYIITAAEATALLGAGGLPFPVIPMHSGYPGARPATWTGHQGLWNAQDASPSVDAYQYDSDNDLDGDPEGVWIDTDFPVQEEPGTGRLFIPMYSITVHDLDALINLNAHGNVSALYDPNSTLPTPLLGNSSGLFGGNDFISQSNQGIGPSEINPGWVMNGRNGVDNLTSAATVFQQHQRFYGNLPSAAGAGPARPWRETANMEQAWIKLGRPELSGSGGVTGLHAGAYGEESLVYNNLASRNPALFPQPGLSGQNADDNGDRQEGMFNSVTSITTAAQLNQFGLQGLANFRHPLDFIGLGSTTLSTNRKTLNLLPLAGSNPNRWTVYTKHASNGNVLLANSLVQGGTLMVQSVANGLLNDPYEMAFDAPDNRAVDDPLEPEDTMFLQLSNSDLDRTGASARVGNLGLFNFSKDSSTNSRGYDIRRKFTSISADRKTFSFAESSNTNMRPWEFNIDVPQAYGPEAKFPPQFNSIPRRYQEQDSDGNGTPDIDTQVPGEFSSDPFRTETRALLEVIRNGTQSTHQRRLSMNQLATIKDGKLSFRSLTPHPSGLGAAAISAVAPAYPPTTDVQREYWARRDRQQMARDIYVMLYLLGGGCEKSTQNDHSGSAIGASGYLKSNASNEIYTAEQLTEMAQFAVNHVDRLDADNVITVFEYDTDLSDGWGLDDNPMTNHAAEADRATVFGVEAQELTLSEALAFRNDPASVTTNHAATEYDDTKAHWFAYCELRNVGPYSISFTNNEEWQVGIRQPASTASQERYLNLRASAGPITSGSMYSIASKYTMGITGGTGTTATFKCDPSFSGSAPDFTMSSTFIAPPGSVTADLDLLGTTPAANFYKIVDGQMPPTAVTPADGGWFNDLSIVDATQPVHFTLRRRAHPTRGRPTTAAEERDNPWVEVDRMVITNLPTFALADTDNMPALVAGKLAVLQSHERRQPFDRRNEPPNGSSPIANTIGQANSNLTTPFTIRQHHVDRDYASIGEWLLLPICGPANITNELSISATKSPIGEYETDDIAHSAAGKFLVPQDLIAGEPKDSNRWHRLWEFFEVPSRINRNLQLGSELEVTRTTGKLNPNAIRHPDVLAAWLDDSEVVDLNLTNPTSPTIDSVATMGEATTRDWWQQFLLARDPVDPYWKSIAPVASQMLVPLPGLPLHSNAPVSVTTPWYTRREQWSSTAGMAQTAPDARPFRGFSDLGDSVWGTGRGMLRTLPNDEAAPQAAAPPSPPKTKKRGLFEVGNSNDHTNGSLDPIVRNGLLSKMLNNATPRSHCFAVFITVKYFQAADDNGAIRIGGPLNGIPEPEYRGFFVVDRSLLEKGYQAGGGGFSTFKPFVTYRKILQEP